MNQLQPPIPEPPSGQVACARCHAPVDVWSYGKSFAVIVLFGLALFIPVITAPIGAIMLLGSPGFAAILKGHRHCRGCKLHWEPKHDISKAVTV